MRRKKPAARCAGGQGMRRRIRRVTGKAGHCAEQPCAGCGDLPKLQGRARCRGRAVFVRCVLRWQRGRNERARARRNRARTRARGRTMDFYVRRWAQAWARCKGAGKGAGKGTGAQWIFCGRRGHGYTAGLFAAGAGAWAHRGSARRALRLTLGGRTHWHLAAFFPCGKKITRRQAR